MFKCKYAHMAVLLLTYDMPVEGQNMNRRVPENPFENKNCK